MSNPMQTTPAPAAQSDAENDFTTNPDQWSKAKTRAYNQFIADAYSDAATKAQADFKCVSTGGINTARACKCPGCCGAVAAHEKQMELTGYVPQGMGPVGPGLINLSDPRLAKDPDVQKLLQALLAKLK